MIWSLDQDDYEGLFCDQGQFPCLKRIHDILFSSDNKQNEPKLLKSTRVTKLSTRKTMISTPIRRLPLKDHQTTSIQPEFKYKIMSSYN